MRGIVMRPWDNDLKVGVDDPTPKRARKKPERYSPSAEYGKVESKTKNESDSAPGSSKKKWGKRSRKARKSNASAVSEAAETKPSISALENTATKSGNAIKARTSNASELSDTVEAISAISTVKTAATSSKKSGITVAVDAETRTTYSVIRTKGKLVAKASASAAANASNNSSTTTVPASGKAKAPASPSPELPQLPSQIPSSPDDFTRAAMNMLSSTNSMLFGTPPAPTPEPELMSNPPKREAFSSDFDEHQARQQLLAENTAEPARNAQRAWLFEDVEQESRAPAGFTPINQTKSQASVGKNMKAAVPAGRSASGVEEKQGGGNDTFAGSYITVDLHASKRTVPMPNGKAQWRAVQDKEALLRAASSSGVEIAEKAHQPPPPQKQTFFSRPDTSSKGQSAENAGKPPAKYKQTTFSRPDTSSKGQSAKESQQPTNQNKQGAFSRPGASTKGQTVHKIQPTTTQNTPTPLAHSVAFLGGAQIDENHQPSEMKTSGSPPATAATKHARSPLNNIQTPNGTTADFAPPQNSATRPAKRLRLRSPRIDLNSGDTTLMDSPIAKSFMQKMKELSPATQSAVKTPIAVRSINENYDEHDETEAEDDGEEEEKEVESVHGRREFSVDTTFSQPDPPALFRSKPSMKNREAISPALPQRNLPGLGDDSTTGANNLKKNYSNNAGDIHENAKLAELKLQLDIVQLERAASKKKEQFIRMKISRLKGKARSEEN